MAAAWRVRDLLAGVEAGPWHLILCRNAAIYLEPVVAADLWRRLAGQLAPGGYLVTGKAENAAHPALERVASCVFRRGKTTP